MSKSRQYIHEYIRERVPDKRKRPIGVIVGTVIDEVIYVGWSKTNIKLGDKFDKKFGIDLALKRAKGLVDTPKLPPQMKVQMREFQVRCLSYFKQAKYMATEGVTPPSSPIKDTEAELKDLFNAFFPKKNSEDILKGIFGLRPGYFYKW